MKIFLIGATGYVGSKILDEALSRNHEVTSLVRDRERLPVRDDVHPAAGDVYDQASVAKIAAGHDAVISAFSPGLSDPGLYERHLEGARAIIAGTKAAQVNRLLFVGGAGSLQVAPGVQLVDTPEFPEQWKKTALATREVLKLLKTEHSLDWTFLCPPAHLEPGERTGKYRIGSDTLLKDSQGQSHISVQDYAVAMIDELEKARFPKKQFTVAY